MTIEQAPRDPEERGVSYWLLSVSKLLERVANEELAPHGITFRQVQVLGTLRCLGEISQAELAERIQVEPSTVVRIVDRMERDGWVERFPDPRDRRVKLLRATAKARPAWDTIGDVAARLHQRLTQGISPRQVAQLNRTLETMCANLEGTS